MTLVFFGVMDEGLVVCGEVLLSLLIVALELFSSVCTFTGDLAAKPLAFLGRLAAQSQPYPRQTSLLTRQVYHHNMWYVPVSRSIDVYHVLCTFRILTSSRSLAAR